MKSIFFGDIIVMRGDIVKKSIKYILIILLILIILIPVIINILFKFDLNIWWIESEWTAGDALNFFGTIVGAIIGILGVYVTVEFAQKNYREDLKNQILPFFSINFLTKQCISSNIFEINDSIEVNEEDDTVCVEDYKEFRLRKVHFILTSNDIYIRTNLNREQIELIRNNGVQKHRKKDGEIIISTTQVFSQAIELENVGKGAAINVRIGINRVETNDNEKILLMPINLKPNEFFYLNIFSENLTKHILGEYILEINYSDIYNNNYIQEYYFEISFINKDGQDGYQIDFDYITDQKNR